MLESKLYERIEAIPELEELYYRFIKIAQKNPLDIIYEKPLKCVENFMNELCDTSKSTVLNLSSRLTYTLRKKLDLIPILNDEGYQYDEFMYISPEEESRQLQEINEKLCSYMNYYIYFFHGTDRSNTMSSLSITEGYENYDMMQNFEVPGTLYDVLSYSRDEIRTVYGNTFYEKFDKMKRELGLKYIDELTIDEKRKIISKASSEVIDNSSISWLSNLDGKIKTRMQEEARRTGKPVASIDMLKTYLSLCKKNINDEAAVYANNVGMDIGKSVFSGEIRMDDNIYSLEQLLEKNVEEISALGEFIYVLKYNNIKRVEDIVICSKEDFEKMPGFDHTMCLHLIDTIHSMGLWFADEAVRMQQYTDEIPKQLNTLQKKEKPDMREMLTESKKLLAEKKYHQEEINKIDSKLNELMEQAAEELGLLAEARKIKI